MEIVTDNPDKIDLSGLHSSLESLNAQLQLNLETLYLHLISDDDLLRVNNEYLQHDYYTDIITFDLRDEITNDAEIYISIERVKENASTYSISEEEELFRVCVHGFLHLAGFKDKTQQEKTIMREMEEKYLKNLFHVKHK